MRGETVNEGVEVTLLRVVLMGLKVQRFKVTCEVPRMGRTENQVTTGCLQRRYYLHHT